MRSPESVQGAAGNRRSYRDNISLLVMRWRKRPRTARGLHHEIPNTPAQTATALLGPSPLALAWIGLSKTMIGSQSMRPGCSSNEEIGDAINTVLFIQAAPDPPSMRSPHL